MYREELPKTTTHYLDPQPYTHVAKKFSGSFSISHVLNLYVEGENQYA